MLVVADGRLVNAIVIQELGGVTGVLAGNQVRLTQDPEGTNGNIFQIADGGGQHEKATGLAGRRFWRLGDGVFHASASLACDLWPERALGSC